jgi:hypothetical protein
LGRRRRRADTEGGGDDRRDPQAFELIEHSHSSVVKDATRRSVETVMRIAGSILRSGRVLFCVS